MSQSCDNIEGLLTLRLEDGREFKTWIVSAEHAGRVVERWQAGECGDDYQAASGGFHPCARPAGHSGHCSHRMERGD